MTAPGRLVLTLAILAGGVPVAGAGAQEGPGRRIELAIGGVLAGPTALGSTAAEFVQTDGRPLPVFLTESRLSPAIGGEAHLGARLTPGLAAEISGGWQRASLRVRIHDDIEDAPDVTADERVWRLTLEGAVVWAARRSDRSQVFLRGGGGWLREMTGGGILARHGSVAHIGAGMKYWWLDRSTGRPSRLGIRIEGRLAARMGGLPAGERTFAVAPAIAGGLIFGL